MPNGGKVWSSAFKKIHPTWVGHAQSLTRAGLQVCPLDARLKKNLQRKTLTHARLTFSSAGEASTWKLITHGLKTEVNCCSIHHYLKFLLFRFLPCPSGYLVFSSLWILNPRQQREIQEDISNTRIKAQSDVW